MIGVVIPESETTKGIFEEHFQDLYVLIAILSAGVIQTNDKLSA